MVWTTSYYHYDAVGSTRMLTGADQSIQASYRHEAFGQPLVSNTTANPFRFVGQLGYYHDAATGLVNVRQRVYDSKTARWLSQDPAESEQNLYRYAFNGPSINVDPSGLYDIAGHFWTTYMVAIAAGKSKTQAYQLAYYAQYPDQDRKLEAVWVASEAETEGKFSLRHDDLGIASAFKQGRDRIWASRVFNWLHSMHGGGPAEVQKRQADLTKILQIPSLKTWQAGLIIHALGDAHSHIDRKTGAAPKYPLGHANDGHRPDYIRSDLASYKKYVYALFITLGGQGDPGQNAMIRAIVKAAIDMPAMPEGITTKQENGFIEIETKRFKALAVGTFGYNFQFVPTDDYNRDSMNSLTPDVTEEQADRLMEALEQSVVAPYQIHAFFGGINGAMPYIAEPVTPPTVGQLFELGR